MPLIELSDHEQAALRQIVKQTRDAKQVKRAQALLWLAQGEFTVTVSQRQEVTRQTIYNWVHAFQARRSEPVRARLQDRPRSGRPPTKRQAVQTVIEEVFHTDPRQWNYRFSSWTTSLLRKHLKSVHDLEVSGRTIRRTLHRLGYRYKRPRYVLARRQATWRQAKGGYSEG